MVLCVSPIYVCYERNREMVRRNKEAAEKAAAEAAKQEAEVVVTPSPPPPPPKAPASPEIKVRLHLFEILDFVVGVS